jgi:TRAP-type C4-dicarboxylate transport system permease small subunit
LTSLANGTDASPGHREPSWPRALVVISRVLALVAGVLIAGLMLLTTFDVLKRKLIGSGAGGTVEYTQVLLVLTVYAGMMSAEVTGSHIRTSVLTERLSPVRAAALRAIGLVGVSALVLWACIETAQGAWDSFSIREFSYGLVRVPVWPARVAIPIGLAGLLGAVVYRAFDAVRVLVSSIASVREAGLPQARPGSREVTGHDD